MLTIDMCKVRYLIGDELMMNGEYGTLFQRELEALADLFPPYLIRSEDGKVYLYCLFEPMPSVLGLLRLNFNHYGGYLFLIKEGLA